MNDEINKLVMSSNINWDDIPIEVHAIRLFDKTSPIVYKQNVNGIWVYQNCLDKGWIIGSGMKPSEAANSLLLFRPPTKSTEPEVSIVSTIPEDDIFKIQVRKYAVHTAYRLIAHGVPYDEAIVAGKEDFKFNGEQVFISEIVYTSNPVVEFINY